MAPATTHNTIAFRAVDVIPVIFAAAMLTVIARSIDDKNDFAAFYAAAREWRTGTPVPNVGPVDLNPPTFSILLSPLTFVSLHVARVLWVALSLAAIADALRRIRSALAVDARTMLWVVCGCVALEPSVFAWGLGQVTWVLAWIVTRAWLAARQVPTHGGLWLGLAIALKPPLALMAILLPITACAAAAGAAVTVTAVGIAAAGWPAWQMWLAFSSRVDWLAWWPNASLWGLAARLHAGGLGPVRFGDLPDWSIAAVALTALALAIVVIRSRGNRRWLLAGLWSLTASPLGWTYYLPILIGPALGSRLASRAAFVAAIAILAAPDAILSAVERWHGWPAALAGSIYTAALACFWLAWRTER